MKTTAKALFCAFLLIMTMVVSVSALTMESAEPSEEPKTELPNVTKTEEPSIDLIDSASCGDNLIYKIYSNGEMVISGTGRMNTWTNSGRRPGWYTYKDVIKSVTIEYGVTSIGGSAFKDCSQIESISIPNSVSQIGTYAFSECKRLESIIIPDNVLFGILEYTFSGCSNLKRVVIGEKVTSIDQYAFSSCTSLEEIVIPDSVTSIASNAFNYCESLTDIRIPDSVTSLGAQVFQYCTNLKTVTFSNSMTSINYGNFNGCTNLQSIIIPSSIKRIANSAFSECENLTDIYYLGTLEEWENVQISNDGNNNVLASATIHAIGSDGDSTFVPLSYPEKTVDRYFLVDDEKTTGIYVIAGVTAIQYANADEYGLLASRKALLDGELTFDSARFVSEAAFKRSEGLDKHFEVTKDGTVRFYGYVYDIPESFRDDVIVIRPYLKFGDYVFYGTAMENSVSSLQP